MKGVFLFSTKLRYYLVQLPLMAMLAVTIYCNQFAEGFIKFYPLIVTFSGIIAVMLVYFFRGIYVKYDKISSIGFSSCRDSVFIKKDCTLVITLFHGHRMNIDLWEYSEEPAFDWMKKEDDVTRDIRIYHDDAFGGARSAAKILRLMGVPEEEAVKLTSEDGKGYEDKNLSAKSERTHDTMQIRLKFLTTVI